MTDAVRESPQGWVPVEDRWFGLDRRTAKPALVVLAIGLLLIYGWQGLNAVIPWDNEIRAGEVLDLGDGATAVPPVGWQLESGSLVGDGQSGASASLVRGGTSIGLQVAKFDGSASALLDQFQRAQGEDSDVGPASARNTLRSDAGLVGVVQSRSGPSGDELEAAFKLAFGSEPAVDAAPGLVVVVVAAPGQFEQNRDVVDQVLRSITPVVTR